MKEPRRTSPGVFLYSISRETRAPGQKRRDLGTLDSVVEDDILGRSINPPTSGTVSCGGSGGQEAPDVMRGPPWSVQSCLPPG